MMQVMLRAMLNIFYLLVKMLVKACGELANINLSLGKRPAGMQVDNMYMPLVRMQLVERQAGITFLLVKILILVIIQTTVAITSILVKTLDITITVAVM